jgi:hypothetical protein
MPHWILNLQTSTLVLEQERAGGKVGVSCDSTFVSRVKNLSRCRGVCRVSDTLLNLLTMQQSELVVSLLMICLEEIVRDSGHTDG